MHRMYEPRHGWEINYRKRRLYRQGGTRPAHVGANRDKKVVHGSGHNLAGPVGSGPPTRPDPTRESFELSTSDPTRPVRFPKKLNTRPAEKKPHKTESMATSYTDDSGRGGVG